MKKLRSRTSSRITYYSATPKRRFRGRHLLLILLTVGVCLGTYNRSLHQKGYASRQKRAAIEATALGPSAVPSQPVLSQPRSEETDRLEIRRLVVHEGDTLTRIVRDAGIDKGYPDIWSNACNYARLDRFKENDELILILNRADGLPVEAVFVQSDGPSYTLRKSSTGWRCSGGEPAAEESGKTVRGAWSNDFYDSCIAGGLPASLISKLVEIFAYDVDFASDLKQGDSFSVFFQEYPIRSSESKEFLILGAEIGVSGKVYQAFGFRLPDGSWDYFDAKGESLKRSFLSGPIDYRPLSSPKTSKGFQLAHKVFRHGLGINYFAPKGTYVRAVGDGFVAAIRKDGRSNFAVDIRHRGGYTSRYGHLEACSRGLKRGAPVARAEVIGSVGSAGGGKAFMDFHFFKGGKPVKFQNVEFTRLQFVPKRVESEFEKTRDFCAAALHGSIPDAQKQEMLSGRD